MLFIFDGERLTDEQLAAIRFEDEEIIEYTFATPDDIDCLTIPRLARRLHAAITAMARQQPLHLEDGTSPVDAG